MTKLCPRGKAAAKRKFAVYTLAYANAYASKICAGKIKDPSGVKRKDFKGRKPSAMGGRIKLAGGGLREATDRLRRQGLRGGGLCKKGMNKKSLENKMAKNGLDKWFKQKWVDIGSKKKVEAINHVEENLRVDQKESIQSACLLQKQQG